MFVLRNSIVCFSILILALAASGCRSFLSGPENAEAQDSGLLSLNLPQVDGETKNYLTHYSLKIAPVDCDTAATGTVVNELNKPWTDSNLKTKVDPTCNYNTEIVLGKWDGRNFLDYFIGATKVDKFYLKRAGSNGLAVKIIATLTEKGKSIEFLAKRFSDGLATKTDAEMNIGVLLPQKGFEKDSLQERIYMLCSAPNPSERDSKIAEIYKKQVIWSGTVTEVLLNNAGLPVLTIPVSIAVGGRECTWRIQVTISMPFAEAKKQFLKFPVSFSGVFDNVITAGDANMLFVTATKVTVVPK